MSSPKTNQAVILTISAILSLSLFGIMVYLFVNPKTGLIPLVFSEVKEPINRLETNSITIKDNGYVWVARMFPQSPPYYQSALFVQKNSSIQSIADFKNTTVIALGDFNSASSFYMPTYDLFGKSLWVDMGHRGEVIQELVKSGKADVGAASYDAVKNDPNFRVIQRSRNIPGSGVYLSPDLSDNDQKAITQALVNAPANIQKKANYGVDEEPDFSYFIQISQRVKEVLKCANFNQNPVNFFCSPATANIPESNQIIGIVNGLSIIENQITRLTLQAKDQKIYYVLLNRKILNQIPNAGSGLNLQNKTLVIRGVIPDPQSNQIVINDPNQIEVFN
ncbi:MAG TPA: PhnD/SsuA/transferrin family substrate-binding protein [Candidatus Obscuribacterales bacterium]